MASSYILGLDYGTDSARGVLIDAATGEQAASHMHAYRHGVMTGSLPDGTMLRRGWALQNAADYLEAAEDILGSLGRDRNIQSIGIDFTASSPMPATAAGLPLSALHPGQPHAYVKLWKHIAAQPQADAINADGGAFLDNFGGRVSGEWLLAKAAQIAEESPQIWKEVDRFIESGDWLVWQLTGNEKRSLAFAAFKAQYSPGTGYPAHLVDGLSDKLASPLPIGSPAGRLSDPWRDRTGITGEAQVAVAVIDSHAVLPAVGAVTGGCLTSALGTSAGHIFLAEDFCPIPRGLEGVARDGTIRGLWCYEAGQASFGDLLAWFTRTFPCGDTLAASFAAYNGEAAALAPGAGQLVALDWWNGNRVPHGDAGLSGLLIGMTMNTTAAAIYRALMEALCFGTRHVADCLTAGGLSIDRMIATSGLADKNPLLIQILADVLQRRVEVPQIANATATGAAIHGAVAAGLVPDYATGAVRYGARQSTFYTPRSDHSGVYDKLYRTYRDLSENSGLRQTMHDLNAILH
ncbi:MAG: carbohydrate kinase [Alphaproteobacteria bacterium]|nr:carbohydrate kinase [Alphaproteobacteria bacterium]